MGGVGCESLLFGDVCFEPREHGVEGVGELAELVLTSFQLDPMGERSACRPACGVGDAGQGVEHAAGENPPSHEPEYQQERQHFGYARSESAQEVGPVGNEPVGCTRADGYVSQEEDPHNGEQHGACEHEKPGVAEGELEANAQPGLSIHGLLSSHPVPGAVSMR